ncbi:pyridoxamine 5'-phosphate oxidase [Echinicola sp. CAU 1574]|uniref:Pyridoxine/pyridoxamine 5'-phosphate oxidase n=1 Tax=Echinicola arenosa TaxID=2774144 RepID=A0ABR9AKK1_9BACT|nr:pyridoxamine 5'-phosphate oxidase [Echinicola arenosa]MBD8489316.1 pyridoxamine 5'-phosphate oxidase [Echinicola arenosa]
MDIAALRTEYSLKSLNVKMLDKSPIKQFESWLDEAIKTNVNEPNAMNLATVSKDHRPSSRIVLLKGIDHGFVFYTNYDSKKGQELNHFPFAAITFFWPELQRQVRIEGKIEKVAPSLSDQYFLSRPKGSQIGAWASPQSQIIPDRTFLEKREAEIIEKFKLEEIQRPAHWGGFRLVPDLVEFWQGRTSRLHDRIQYRLKDKNTWTTNRLAP